MSKILPYLCTGATLPFVAMLSPHEIAGGLIFCLLLFFAGRYSRYEPTAEKFSFLWGVFLLFVLFTLLGGSLRLTHSPVWGGAVGGILLPYVALRQEKALLFAVARRWPLLLFLCGLGILALGAGIARGSDKLVLIGCVLALFAGGYLSLSAWLRNAGAGVESLHVARIFALLLLFGFTIQLIAGVVEIKRGERALADNEPEKAFAITNGPFAERMRSVPFFCASPVVTAAESALLLGYGKKAETIIARGRASCTSFSLTASLAEMEIRREDYDEALRFLGQCGKYRNDDEALACYRLSLKATLLLGRFSEGKEGYSRFGEKAIVAPENPYENYLLGRRFEEWENPAVALQYLAAAEKGGLSLADLDYQTARALLSLKRNEEARAKLERSLALLPSHRGALTLLRGMEVGNE